MRIHAELSASGGGEALALRPRSIPQYRMADETPRPVAPRRFVPLGILVLAGALFMVLGGHRYLTIAAIAENRERVCDLVGAAQAMAALAFILCYAGLVALSVPGGALLTITSGFL